MSELLHVELRNGAYADSVTLLQVSHTVQGLDGVLAAQVAMATGLNIEVLTGMGFDVPAEATANDMVVALRLDEADALDRASTPRSATPTAATTGPPRWLPRGPPPPPCVAPTTACRWSPCRARARWWRRWTPSTPAAT